ncbi:hypothetical protein [Carboxylicivirga sp. RSCT41]|uniref:hypothetical protein n=1 Tax=Carboxylicivirga agarovorans TaxID=3417570 RepID=UPI003D3289B6
MPSQKIAVLLNSSKDNTALLEYAGCYAKKTNAKLCIISNSHKTNEQYGLNGIKHKLRLIETVNNIFKSQSLSFEIIVTIAQSAVSLASLFIEYAFSHIIINDTNKELVEMLVVHHHLPIVIYTEDKAISKYTKPFFNKA